MLNSRLAQIFSYQHFKLLGENFEFRMRSTGSVILINLKQHFLIPKSYLRKNFSHFQTDLPCHLPLLYNS